MDKMIKTAKNLHTMAKTAGWICLVAAIIMPIAAFVIRLLPKSSFAGAAFSLDVGNFDLSLWLDGVAPGEVTRQNIISGLLFATIVLVLAWLCLRIIVKMLEPMTQGRPFTQEVAACLNKLSWIALVSGAVYQFGAVVLSAIQYSSYNLDMIFDSAVITGYTIEYELNLNFILLFMLLRLMSYVFQYGLQLQQLEDETL